MVGKSKPDKEKTYLDLPSLSIISTFRRFPRAALTPKTSENGEHPRFSQSRPLHWAQRELSEKAVNSGFRRQTADSIPEACRLPPEA